MIVLSRKTSYSVSFFSAFNADLLHNQAFLKNLFVLICKKKSQWLLHSGQ